MRELAVEHLAAAEQWLENNREKILDKNHKLTAEVLKKVLASKIDSFKVVFHDSATTASVIEDTLESEKTTSKEEAMVEIYKRLRPGETPSIETARALFENLFFNAKRYDLSPVGRLNLNKKLGLDLDLTGRGMGVRSRRYSMIIHDGVVKSLNVEEGPGVDKSGAPAMCALA